MSANAQRYGPLNLIVSMARLLAFYLFSAVYVPRVIYFVLRYPDDPSWYEMARWWGHVTLRIFGVEVVARGAENLQRGRDYVILSNHRSHFDVLAILEAFAGIETRWVAKRELTRVPLFGYGLRVTGQILVDRKDHEQALEALRKSLNDRGVSVVFFPEGHRAETTDLLPFKKGGAAFAIQAGLPVVPIAISGSQDVLPARSLVAMPGRIVVSVGEPIEVVAMTLDDRGELTDRVRENIESRLAHMEGRSRDASRRQATVGAHA
jgi:1-acyl-sn-glycerol-3-phosphate acyltransferase